jgi:hypothetical protein
MLPAVDRPGKRDNWAGKEQLDLEKWVELAGRK